MKVIAKSDVGKRRKNNEDSFIIKNFNNDVSLFIVADGLGGYLSGEVASKLLTEVVSSYIESNLKDITLKTEEEIKDILRMSVIKANEKIYNLEKTDEKYEGMGTTVVAILKVMEDIYYTSVGDTRMYYIPEDFKYIKQITEDDTYVNMLLKTKAITLEEAKTHSQKHVLTKAIGVIKNLDVKVEKLEMPYGILLLCSDGLTNMVEDNEILQIVKNNKFGDVADALVNKANANGGNDNITVLLVKERE